MIAPPGTGSFAQEVVGESHYQANFGIICGERTPEGENRIVDAVVILEDDNPHDDQAVRVDIQGLAVGYLPRADARAFRKWLRKQRYKGTSYTYPAMIKGGWYAGPGDTGNYGVRLDLDIPQRSFGKIILYLILGLIIAFVACVAFGMLLQLLGYSA